MKEYALCKVIEKQAPNSTLSDVDARMSRTINGLTIDHARRTKLTTVESRYKAVEYITYSTAMAAAELKSDIELTKDTPFLALMGELWSVCSKDLGENWPVITALHCTIPYMYMSKYHCVTHALNQVTDT